MKVSTNNKKYGKKLIPIEDASRIFGYSKDNILYLGKTEEIKIINKDFSYFVDFDSLNEYRKNNDQYFKREISKDWRKRKQAGRLVYDTTLPVREDIIKTRKSIIKKVKLVEKKISIWTKAFYLSIKTLKYGLIALLFGIVLFGGFLSWAFLPKIEIVEIYPTGYEGDWKNMNSALERNLSEDSDLDSFSLENSASINSSGVEAAKKNIESEDLAEPEIFETEYIEEEIMNEPEPDEEESIDTEEETSADKNEEEILLEQEDLEQEDLEDENLEIITGETAETAPEEATEQIEQEEETIEQQVKVQENTSPEPVSEEPVIEEISLYQKTKNMLSILVAKAEDKIENIKKNKTSNDEDVEIANPESDQEEAEEIIKAVEDTEDETKEENQENVFENIEVVLPDIDGNFPSDNKNTEEEQLEEQINENAFENQEGIILPDLDGNFFSNNQGDSSQFQDSTTQIFTEQRSVTYSGFSLPIQESEIKKIKFGLSFTSAGEVDQTDEIIAQWSTNGEDWNTVFEFVQNQNYSNKDNGGYFYADIFDIENSNAYHNFNFDNIENLNIKFTLFGNDDQWNDTFIDAVWLETEYVKNDQDEEDVNEDIGVLEILSTEKDFKADDNPEFHFKYKKKEKGIISSILDNLINRNNDYWKDVNFTVEIINPQGKSKEIKDIEDLLG